MNKIKKVCFNTYHGFKNLYSWLPIIWKDRDSDYQSLLIILEKKLKNMSNSHKYISQLSDSEQCQQDLDTAAILTKRLVNDVYKEEVFKGHSHLVIKDSEFELKDGYLIFNSLSEEEWKEKIKLYDLAGEMMLKDKKTLFKMIDDNLLDWWY